MIRNTIEPGTRVWHSKYGMGTYKGNMDNRPEMAEVDFDDWGIVLAYRKNINEIVGS